MGNSSSKKIQYDDYIKVDNNNVIINQERFSGDG